MNLTIDKLTVRQLKIGLYVFLAIVLIVIGAIFMFKKPSNNHVFQAQYMRLPSINIQGDEITVNNFRDLRYRKDGSIDAFNYSNKQYLLSELDSVWFGLSHFGKGGLAHAFVSFGFNGGQESNNYLSVSIEARLKKDQGGYHPIKGLLRNYTKTVVLASEQDVIGVRTHIRNEAVYLYKLDIQGLYTRALLLNFLRKAEHLNQRPEFYNTLTDNCLTGLISETGLFDKFYQWLDYRIILPGYSAGLLREYQNTDQSLDEMNANALIKIEGYGIDDTDFSSKIRGNF